MEVVEPNMSLKSGNPNPQPGNTQPGENQTQHQEPPNEQQKLDNATKTAQIMTNAQENTTGNRRRQRG
ncbi:hypothetical protein GCM10011511_15750 [Puia dinghuensis]|uniref:Uncharacterized protein n=1 Tax=Puia dinghuensis TaxID=1792502 RepID=A0A8J2UBF4_9BACT|nr:hypothetical protein GCM10011511_15750 [Puia dinghuensis]